ncbi:hypothetical protein EYF80_008235 [Liparis tanakae]|uniref:Uncharacterized protein n=1 Tax=Liparis tanakae TaxID=230148 RepID=A0A4Z2IW53_9TELE|nr:hypothetical protein EYF80_008235 [Liparis tanakae]
MLDDRFISTWLLSPSMFWVKLKRETMILQLLTQTVGTTAHTCKGEPGEVGGQGGQGVHLEQRQATEKPLLIQYYICVVQPVVRSKRVVTAVMNWQQKRGLALWMFCRVGPEPGTRLQ